MLGGWCRCTSTSGVRSRGTYGDFFPTQEISEVFPTKKYQMDERRGVLSCCSLVLHLLVLLAQLTSVFAATYCCSFSPKEEKYELAATQKVSNNRGDLHEQPSKMRTKPTPGAAKHLGKGYQIKYLTVLKARKCSPAETVPHPPPEFSTLEKISLKNQSILHEHQIK